MDCSALSEFGGSPIDSEDCMTSSNVPPDSTCMIASKTLTYSEMPYCTAYRSTIGRCASTSADRFAPP